MSYGRRTTYFPPARGTNGLGIAGFVVSLASFLVCGLTSPIGLVLSVIALRRRPRGLALAGAVLGGLGTALIVGAGALMVQTGHEVKSHFENQRAERQTRIVIAEGVGRVEQFRAEQETLPDGIQGNKLLLTPHDAALTDAWGNPLRYDLQNDTYLVRSAGADGAFETNDDVTSEPRPRDRQPMPGDLSGPDEPSSADEPPIKLPHIRIN